MPERTFHAPPVDYRPGVDAREVWRAHSHAGHVILFETVEEHVVEIRHPPWGEELRAERVLRAVCEQTDTVSPVPKAWTLVLDGCGEGGALIETAELAARDRNFGKALVGHRFSALVSEVRIRGSWCEGDAEPG